MAPRFVFCPACNRPAHPHERQCPFCDAPFAPDAARSVGAGVALTVGLSLVAGCEPQSALAQTPGNTRVDAATVRATDATVATAADVGFPGLGLPGSGFGVYGAPPSALRRTGPVVRALPSTVEGALGADVVRRIVLRHLGQVSFCVGTIGDGGPAVTGRAVVRIEIDAQGAVTGSSIESSSLPTSAAECIVAASRRWTFPAPGQGTVTVHQPFVVQPANP